ncbi:MAG: aconitate hydratase AcnA [Roseovarius sp.]
MSASACSLARDVERDCGVAPAEMPRAAYLLAENVAAFAKDPQASLAAIGRWLREGSDPGEIPFRPTRILMQDTAGVAALADLAALRDRAARIGLAPETIDSALPIDLVIDHSVTVEHSGRPGALALNMAAEMSRNAERYQFFKWAEQAFRNLRVVPPGEGICHQINLENLARLAVPLPDGRGAVCGSVIGTDSHTTMINALGIIGWGVGGMEAELAALDQPLALGAHRLTRVVLTGQRQAGVAAAELALAVTRTLRQADVTAEFVEFGGPALDALSLPDRAAIANMAPEYGAFCGLFPVDEATLHYLRQMGRTADELALYEAYARETGLWRSADERRFWQREIVIDLSEVGLSMAGPSRPDEFVKLGDVPGRLAAGGGGPHHVAIAAITSCTNTANPASMIAAGLVARAARRHGLDVPEHVKTSLAPGSRRIARLLAASGLQDDLDALGFNVAGFGCTTCVGNSGELAPSAQDLRQGGGALCAVLSGNRNFEGRIHPDIGSNWLASPALVVVAALAGRLDMDLSDSVIAHDDNGAPVRLVDLWPDDAKIEDTLMTTEAALSGPAARERNPEWEALAAPGGTCFPWDTDSLVLQPPPFFDEAECGLADLSGARILLALGDAVTTDQISPVGRIMPDSPAARLIEKRSGRRVFGTYGGHRANHDIMVRGTFAHTHIENRLAPGRGPMTALETGEVTDIFTAASRYREGGVPTVVLAGARYGMGSARDWAAKGTRMLGVKAVLATGFERIHRANLIGAGVVPIQVPAQLATESAVSPWSTVSVSGLAGMDGLGHAVRVRLETPGHPPIDCVGVCRIETPSELQQIRAGGVFALTAARLARTTGARMG